jgi:dipeptidyl aminopeptidase/acylaminoacyl peptidase
MTPRTAPYGSWKSPITSNLLVADVVRLSNPTTDGDDVYWVEGRPQENGRYALVRRNGEGDVRDVLPDGFAVRTLAHEYGGLCYVVRGGVVYFSNFDDQRLYRAAPGTGPRAITAAPPSPRAWRFADPVVTRDGAYLICVRERHEGGEVVNDLVILPTDGSASARVLADGHDFFAAPALSPSGDRLAWISWDHPRMPWDGTELHEAALDASNAVLSERVVCGGDDESVIQPRYGRDATLYYVSDRTGWWNLYADGPAGATALAARNAEFAGPAWNFGTSSYSPLDDGSVAVTWFEHGASHLGVIDDGGDFTEVALAWSNLGEVRRSAKGVVALVGSPVAPASIAEVDLSSGDVTVLKASQVSEIDLGYISVPEAIEFPTEEGLVAHALFFPPTNRDFVAPDGERPPLIVASHGGPTAHANAMLNYEVQYWTSRGISVVDVDYGGSTGYGRDYRERLKGKWGIVDLDDCVNAALYLAATDRADRARLLIHGGSAGGYTTLCALTFRDVFAAGASSFGVADLGALARDTHKFESRYLDGLVGRWPQDREIYEARSPIFHVDLLRTPTILFQGLEDEVVPPAQTEMMADALAERGVPFAYLAFEGEQHGFRQAKNIIRRTEAELYFYGKVLGFQPADEIEPVEIENADALG